MAGTRVARPLNGWLTFAAVIMFIVGFHNLIYGIASLRDYTVVVNNLNGGTSVIYADTTFWGWLWIVVGVVEILIAFGIAARNEAARWGGVAIATINAIGQLAFLAAFPVWSVVIIAIDVVVIYVLCTYDAPRARAGYEEPYPSDQAGVSAGREAGVGRLTETGGTRVTSGGGVRREEGPRPPTSG